MTMIRFSKRKISYSDQMIDKLTGKNFEATPNNIVFFSIDLIRSETQKKQSNIHPNLNNSVFR